MASAKIQNAIVTPQVGNSERLVMMIGKTGNMIGKIVMVVILATFLLRRHHLHI